MKKTLLLLTIVIASLSLSSFKNIDNSSATMKTEDKTNVDNADNDYIYYTSITAWCRATESNTFYIFYKEGNGERDYTVAPSRNLNECFFTYIIYKNGRYGDPECKDYRKNYQYKFNTSGGFTYYFNCDLPYMNFN